MIGTYLAMNAWRELLVRIFENIPAEDQVSPPWLINPATRRRLKLDRLYSDIHIAIRFVGLMARGVGRQSDDEVRDTENRDETREELCRRNGVELVRINADGEEPVKQIDTLIRAIVRAGQRVDQSSLPAAQKTRLAKTLVAARTRADNLRMLVQHNPEQMMANLSDAWRDREAGLAYAPPPAPKSAPPSGRLYRPREGERVEHERFGAGVVTSLLPDKEGDTKITILFDGAQERTFLLSLVQAKLSNSR